MAYYAVLCARGLLPRGVAGRLGVVRLAARAPPRPQPGARGRDLRGLARPRAAAGRRDGARAARAGASTRASSCWSGDAELDEGSNHEAIELAGGARPRRAHRGGRRQRARRRYAVPGPDRAAVRHRGLARRRPSTAATTTRSRRPCPSDDVRRPQRRSSADGGGEAHDDDPRQTSSPAPPPSCSRRTCRSRWSTPRSPGSSSARSSAGTPTGWSTSASASSCWSTSAPGWR